MFLFSQNKKQDFHRNLDSAAQRDEFCYSTIEKLASTDNPTYLLLNHKKFSGSKERFRVKELEQYHLDFPISGIWYKCALQNQFQDTRSSDSRKFQLAVSIKCENHSRTQSLFHRRIAFLIMRSGENPSAYAPMALKRLMNFSPSSCNRYHMEKTTRFNGKNWIALAKILERECMLKLSTNLWFLKHEVCCIEWNHVKWKIRA